MNFLTYWALLNLCVLFSLPFIPLFDLYYLIPDHGIDFSIMPKMEKFLATYSLEEVNKYNTIVWNSFYLWLLFLIFSFVSTQIVNRVVNKRHCKRNWGSYLKTFFYASLPLIFFSSVFIFYELKVLRSNANNIDYVNLMLIQDYVYWQCQLFLNVICLCTLLFILLTVDDFDNQTLVFQARKNKS